MQSVSSKKYITVKSDNKAHKLKVDEYARWMCLIEALDYISKKAGQFKVDLHDKNVDWVKPLAFQKYIDERFESMKDEVLLNEVDLSESEDNFNNNTCTTSSELQLA
ncbi:hypothetical protein EBR43_05335 [bacterium]|nr:hypothetical protein [bacterium]